MISRIAKTCMTGLLALMPVLAFAQRTITVTGTVVDDSAEPVIGASVLVAGTTTGVPTDLDGRYSITVPSNASLEFSSVGLTTVVEPVNGRTVINVVLATDNTFLESVVVVGYGTQKKGSVTGAIAGIGSDELIKTKSENPQNMLTGRVPGLRVWQTSAEPGSYSSNIDIRGYGSMLVVIDGVPRTIEDFNRLNANDIENVSVLKDGAAAIYGMRGGNGVLLVTTKKGAAETSKVTYNGSFTFQTPSGLPELADVVDAMKIYNEKAYNNISGGAAVFSDEFISEFTSGTRKATDWNDLVIQRVAPQTAHDVSVSGGTEKYQYYVSMGYSYQEGFFKSGDLNYDKYNVRANIAAEVVKGLKLDASVAGVVDQQNKPQTESDWLIRNWWRQGSVYPAYADPEGTLLSYVGMDLKSMALEANAWHHRSDALSSIATLVGIGGAIYLGHKWTILDPVAGMAVSLFIVAVAVKLAKPAVQELLEVTLPQEDLDRIGAAIASVPGVKAYHNLRCRHNGNVHIVDFHIKVDGNLTVTQAHDISTHVENRLRDKLGNVIANIHIEPYKGEPVDQNGRCDD